MPEETLKSRLALRQPHFTVVDGEVWDTRIVPAGPGAPFTPAQEFNGPYYEQPALAAELATEPRRKDPYVANGYVNRIELVDSVGMDGEESSGCLELLKVNTPTGKEVGIIRAIQSSHHNGLVFDGHSWVAEFKGISAAQFVWDKYQPRYFALDTFEDKLDEIIEHEPTIEAKLEDVYEVGEAIPWYDQKPNDLPIPGTKLILEAANGDTHRRALVDRFRTHPDFPIGRVFLRPVLSEVQWFETAKVRGFVARTCLGAVDATYKSGFTGSERTPFTAVQWDDGVLSRYIEGDTVAVPLSGNQLV